MRVAQAMRLSRASIRTGPYRWATYFGGSDDDEAEAIVTNSKHEVAVGGWTRSTSGIATAGSYQSSFGRGRTDAFVALFDSNRVLKWSTYIAGNGLTIPPPSPGNPAATDGESIAVDSADNIIVSGTTDAEKGIATAGAYKTKIVGAGLATYNHDSYLAEFSPAGAMVWATLFGGTSDELGTPMCVDTANNIYIAGQTHSPGGVATSGAYRTTPGTAFFAKFSSTGSLQWGTYYTDSITTITRLACGKSGSLYFAAWTSEPGLATTGAYQTVEGGWNDGLFGKFSPSGQRLWTSYIGDTAWDILEALTVDT